MPSNVLRYSKGSRSRGIRLPCYACSLGYTKTPMKPSRGSEVSKPGLILSVDKMIKYSDYKYKHLLYR